MLGEKRKPKEEAGIRPLERFPAWPALDEFDRMFDEMRREIDATLSWAGPTWWRMPSRMYEWAGPGWRVPRIDVRDEEKQYTIAFEVPGIPKEQIEILTTDDRLEVRGEAKEEKEEERKGYRYREIGRCAFRRVVPLPVDADLDEVDAKLEDGVLTLTVPKTPGKSTARKITVK